MANLIRGCFYGSIFGDACGAPFELKRKKTPLKNILAFFEENLSGGNSCLPLLDKNDP